MKQLKNRIFFKMLAAMGMTLGAGLVLFPLLLPTENYFRMMLQLVPMAVIIAILLVFPLHMLSQRLARQVQYEKKQAAFSVEPTIPTVIDIPTEIPEPVKPAKPAPKPRRTAKPAAEQTDADAPKPAPRSRKRSTEAVTSPTRKPRRRHTDAEPQQPAPAAESAEAPKEEVPVP